MKVIFNSIIPAPGFIAFTLWPFIFVRRKAAPRYTEVTDRHENIHGLQQKEMLVVLFLAWYGIEWFVRFCILHNSHKAYRAISLEQEAYDNEHDPGYLDNRRPYAWTAYLKRTPAS